MMAFPGATPVTSPDEETVAIPVASECHVMGRPPKGFPAESNGVAVSCVVCLTMIVGWGGVMLIDETGTVETLTVAVPVTAPMVALMCAVPTDRATTRPDASTVATDALSVAHVAVA